MLRALGSLFAFLSSCTSSPPAAVAPPTVQVEQAPSTLARNDRFDALLRANGECRPDLQKFHSSALADALSSTDGLWDLLIAPETPYAERLAAAVQGASVLPFECLPRLMAARRELERERRAHLFGLRPHPLLDSTGGLWAEPVPEQRTILGHAWVLPRELADYPVTWDEECGAPWPWQVKQALDALYNRLADRASGWEGPSWHAASLLMPWDTDGEATSFVDASSAGIHTLTLPVLARWRAIALRADLPEAAQRAASKLSEVHRRWQNPRAKDFAALLALDILQASPVERARHDVAYSVAGMGRTILELPKESPAATPIAQSLILELGRRGLDPGVGDDWTRLYVYVFSFCECLENPPIVVDRRLDPESSEVQHLLSAFESWFREHEAALEAGSAQEGLTWNALREELESSRVR